MNGRRCKPVYGFQLPSGMIKAGFIAGSGNPAGSLLTKRFAR
jgi:hypothetical protein